MHIITCSSIITDKAHKHFFKIYSTSVAHWSIKPIYCSIISSTALPHLCGKSFREHSKMPVMPLSCTLMQHNRTVPVPTNPTSWVRSHVGIPFPNSYILNGPQTQKQTNHQTAYQNLLSVWPAANITPKRASGGFSLWFAFSRDQWLRRTNFLALHHKSKHSL